jgi:hypothetical protein
MHIYNPRIWHTEKTFNEITKHHKWIIIIGWYTILGFRPCEIMEQRLNINVTLKLLLWNRQVSIPRIHTLMALFFNFFVESDILNCTTDI